MHPQACVPASPSKIQVFVELKLLSAYNCASVQLRTLVSASQFGKPRAKIAPRTCPVQVSPSPPVTSSVPFFRQSRHRVFLQRLIPLVLVLRHSLMRLFFRHIRRCRRLDLCPVRTCRLRRVCFDFRLRISVAANTPASAQPALAHIALGRTGASQRSGPARSSLLLA